MFCHCFVTVLSLFCHCFVTVLSLFHQAFLLGFFTSWAIFAVLILVPWVAASFHQQFPTATMAPTEGTLLRKSKLAFVCGAHLRSWPTLDDSCILAMMLLEKWMCVKLLTSLVCVFVCIKHKLMVYRVYTQALFFSFFMLLNDPNFLIQYSS